MEKLYKIQIPLHYPKDCNCFEVVLDNEIFMPFDIVSGLDGCPPDNHNYKKNRKTHWWVFPKTKRSFCDTQSMSYWMDLPTREFKKLEDAIDFCLKWRKEWLIKQLTSMCA